MIRFQEDYRKDYVKLEDRFELHTQGFLTLKANLRNEISEIFELSGVNCGVADFEP
jgi:hypothetical protein